MSKKVPMLDVVAQNAPLRDEIDRAIAEVLNSGRFILGPVVERFEQECAEYCQVSHAIGVSSGTDALLVALMAEGIGPGDEVITSPFSFFATAGCIARVGATPVFADIDPVTFNLDPEKAIAKITPRTRAFLPVHLFGQCADTDPLVEVARQRGLVVIEDAAQAIGAELRGRRAGGLGTYGCFSFYPSKNLGGIGDGGLVTTPDPDRAERVRRLRAHGARPKYFHAVIGGNFRLDAIQAAVLSVKLRHVDAWTEARQNNAARYRTLLVDLDGAYLTLPRHTTPGRHGWNQYTVRAHGGRRDAVRERLRDAGIDTEVYYPLPLHLQECFRALGYSHGDLPVSEDASREVLSLPVYPELDEAQVAAVAAALRPSGIG